MATSVGIVGAGSWGTALAHLLATKGESVTLWAYEPEVVEGIQAHHRNPLYLRECHLPATVRAVADFKEAVVGQAVVVSVVPAQHLRAVWQKAAPFLDAKTILVSCTKGIEVASGKLLSQVLAEVLPKHPKAHFSFLSGPSFAQEVAVQLPTSVVVAGTNPAVTEEVQHLFRTPYFLVFTHDDVIGVEVGGAVKNVIAIATGLSDGLGFGHNTRAAIITRGLYEMIKLGRALGANPLTFAGLSGMGDLILTCTGELSRNRKVGQALAKGKTLAEIQQSMQMVAEGVPTAKAVYQLIMRHGVHAPICVEMYRLLYEGKTPREVVETLTTMPLKEELGGILT